MQKKKIEKKKGKLNLYCTTKAFHEISGKFNL